MDSIQQIYATNQTPLSQTFRASGVMKVTKEKSAETKMCVFQCQPTTLLCTLGSAQA